MIDLIKFGMFFYSFKLILNENSILGIVIFTVFVIFYSIKYFRMKCYIEKNFNNNKKSLDKQKEFFIDTMTHDFKVPAIAQLRGLELLKNETLGKINSEQKDLIINIENSCRYLLEMIDMFSCAYMYEKKEYKLNYETFNISELILSSFEKLSDKVNEKNITFSYNSQYKNLVIEADKKEIQRVLLNLISCAINYSSKNNRIDINLTSNGEYLTFSILGMDLMNNETQNFKGSKYSTIGETLGIYISKKIIELHNGRMSFAGTVQNKNKLYFIIPQYKTLSTTR